MHKIIKSHFKILFLLKAIFLFTACQTSPSLILTNTSDRDAIDQPVAIGREVFYSAKDELPLFITHPGDTVAAQFIDSNEDGAWDEVIVNVSTAAQATEVFEVRWLSPDTYPSFEPRSRVYLGVSEGRDGRFIPVDQETRPTDHEAQSKPYLYQYEGPGWESERVAFRSYFDSRNGKDIFGKAQPGLKLSSIGRGENYHQINDWGMDILKVGASLGAGALAIQKDDTLLRLGATTSAHFQILSNGPIRSSLKLSYIGWEVMGDSYSLEEIITINAGDRGYQSDIRLTPGYETDTLVAGLVDLKEADMQTFELDGWHALYTHGKQSENDDFLGMALLVKAENFIQFTSAPKKGGGITHSYLAHLRPEKGRYSFRFFAGWEGENPQFKSKDFFENELRKEIKKIYSQLDITYHE